jgi:hypothetical protein
MAYFAADLRSRSFSIDRFQHENNNKQFNRYYKHDADSYGKDKGISDRGTGHGVNVLRGDCD